MLKTVPVINWPQINCRKKCKHTLLKAFHEITHQICSLFVKVVAMILRIFCIFGIDFEQKVVFVTENLNLNNYMFLHFFSFLQVAEIITIRSYIREMLKNSFSMQCISKEKHWWLQKSSTKCNNSNLEIDLNLSTFLTFHFLFFLGHFINQSSCKSM